MHATLGMLCEEHRLIERVIAVLERATARLYDGEHVPPHLLRHALTFMAEFFQERHDRKEEVYLFPAMRLRPGPDHRFQVPGLVEDHHRALQFVPEVDAAISKLEASHPGEPREAAVVLGSYCALLRRHLEHEEQELFPQADRTLKPNELEEMARGFQAVEAMQGDGQSRYLNMVERLEVEMLEAFPVASAS